MAAAVSSQVQLLAKGRAPELSSKFVIGDSVVTNDIVRMRRTPGFRGKPISDVITDIISGVTGKVLGGPRQMDNLTWWQIEMRDAIGRTVSGWMAEETATGIPLLVGNTREAGSATIPARPQPAQPAPEPALPLPEPEPPESPNGYWEARE